MVSADTNYETLNGGRNADWSTDYNMYTDDSVFGSLQRPVGNL